MFQWLRLDDTALLASCRMTMLRRSGPGGQHRNKVSTAVVLEHLPTGMRAEANERRSQAENRREALARLRLELALNGELPALDLEQYRPSGLWKSRSTSGQLVVSAEHRDYPLLVYEARAVLAANRWVPAQAAEKLGCSASQLIKLLRREPRALAWLNQQRAAEGMRPLR